MTKDTNTLRANDPATWLETIWSALEGYREDCIPEGEESYDDEWSELTTAMAWIKEALETPPEPIAEQLLSEALDLLNDAPCFGLRRDRKRTSYELASRIDAHRRELAEADELDIEERILAKRDHEESMSAADLSPADWLAIQNAVSNDGDLSNAKRIRLVDKLGDFHASAEEARA